jgi:hypothetical protein
MSGTWLTTPAGIFNLTMRFYTPLAPILDGSYKLPSVSAMHVTGSATAGR